MRKLLQNKKAREGQILIMVLIVLMILGIMVVSVSNTIIRDTQESIINTQLTDQYSQSEALLIAISQDLDLRNLDLTTTGALSDLQDSLANSGTYDTTLYEFPVCEQPGPGETVFCSIEVLNPEENPEVNPINFKLESSNSILNARLAANEIVQFRIDGATTFPDSLDVSLGSDFGTLLNNLDGAALEVAIDYRYQGFDGSTHSSTIKEVHQFGGNGFFTSGLINEFEIIDGAGATFSVDINTAVSDLHQTSAHHTGYFVNGAVATSDVLGVRFKLYANDTSPNQNIAITVEPNAPGFDVIQSRVLEATTTNLEQASDSQIGAQPIVVTSVPLFKPLPLFDYVLRTEGSIN